MKRYYHLMVILMMACLLLTERGRAQPPERGSDSLSVGEARLTLLKSLALPGWGEHSLGYQTRAYGFNGAELLGWITYAVLQIYAQGLEKDMVTYAVKHAGIDPSGKDDAYLTDIGNYQDIYAYNDQKLRYRQTNLVYPDTEAHYWSWDSEKSRKHFDDKRYYTALMYRNASFALTALVVNRIISMIDVIALTKDRVVQSSGFYTSLRPTPYKITLSLNWQLK